MNAFQKIFGVSYLVMTAYWAVIFFSGWTDSFHNYFYSFLFGLIPLFGGPIAMYQSRIWGGLKSAVGKASFFVGLGVFAWGFGELIWSYYNFVLNVPAPYPSLADIGFAPSIFFYSLGAFYLARPSGANIALRYPIAKVFAGVSALAVLIFSWYVLVVIARGGVLIPEGDGGIKLFFDLVYPFGGYVGLLTAVLVSGLSFKYLGGRYRADVLAVLLGLGVMYIGDTVFSYTTTVGTYYNAQFGDLLLATGTFLLTFGALGFSTHKTED